MLQRSSHTKLTNHAKCKKCQTILEVLQHHLRFSILGFVDQPKNPVVFW
jgi:hypothetical protein